MTTNDFFENIMFHIRKISRVFSFIKYKNILTKNLKKKYIILRVLKFEACVGVKIN